MSKVSKGPALTLAALAAGVLIGAGVFWLVSRSATSPASSGSPAIPSTPADPRAAARPREARRSRTIPEDTPWLRGQLRVEADADVNVLAKKLTAYGKSGYDFVVLLGDNRLPDVPSLGKPIVLRGVALRAHPARCEPPRADGAPCLVAVDAIGVGAGAALKDWPKDVRSPVRTAQYVPALDAARSLGSLPSVDARALGTEQPALGSELVHAGARLLVIADSFGAVLGAEGMWDHVLSSGAMLYAAAAESLPGPPPAGADAGSPGEAFVMVRAYPDAQAIREALEAGNFYASTGVELSRAGVREGLIEVEVAFTSEGDHNIAFVGSNGSLLGFKEGRKAALRLDSLPEGPVRAVVRDRKGRFAWTQPVFVH